MARSESIHKGPQRTDSNTTGGLAFNWGGGRHRLHAGVCLAGILLAGSACCLGASGPGIGVKVGAQTLKDPVDLSKTTRARLELELSTARFCDDHFDLAFTVGGSSLGSFSARYADVFDGVLVEESYKDELGLIDLRLAARFYPLGDAGRIRPYMGAGAGYFWFLDRWRYRYAETIPDPYFPNVYHTFIDEYRGTDTLAKGFFSFATAGLTVPVGFHGELLFEFQYDFAKKDRGFDLGGPIYMVGARFRF